MKKQRVLGEPAGREESLPEKVQFDVRLKDEWELTRMGTGSW